MTAIPQSGGRYSRDRDTGELTRLTTRTDQTVAPTEAVTAADDPATAKTTKKGGR